MPSKSKKASTLLDLRKSRPHAQRLLRGSTQDSDERSAKHTSAIASTLTLKGFVEGHPVPMLVDTGSSVTLLHESVWKEAVKNSKLELKQARCPVMAVNGESLPLCGQAYVTLQVGDYTISWLCET